MDQHGTTSEIFISISGMIGAGKTTLADALGEKLSLPVYHEPVADNAYLADFYKDKLRYGFPLQVYLLNRRFQQHQQIIWTGKGIWCTVVCSTLLNRGLCWFRTLSLI